MFGEVGLDVVVFRNSYYVFMCFKFFWLLDFMVDGDFIVGIMVIWFMVF